TKAFCGSNKGKLTRINLSDPVIANWSSTPIFHDLYSLTNTPLSLVPKAAFAAPALATRGNGNLMVIYGNGDPTDLEGTDPTRMAFVEEQPNFDPITSLLTSFTANQKTYLV